MSEEKESTLSQIESVGYTDIYSAEDLETVIDLEVEDLITINTGMIHCRLTPKGRKYRAENSEDSE